MDISESVAPGINIKPGWTSVIALTYAMSLEELILSLFKIYLKLRISLQNITYFLLEAAVVLLWKV